MKKYLKIFSVFLVAGMIFSACSESGLVGPDGPDGPDDGNGTGEGAWITFAFDLNGSSTKAAESGTSGEQLIDSLLVLLYDATSPYQFKYAIPIRATNHNNGTLNGSFVPSPTSPNDTILGGSTSSSVQTKATRIKRQDYLMVVVANQAPALSTTLWGTQYANLTSASTTGFLTYDKVAGANSTLANNLLFSGLNGSGVNPNASASRKSILMSNAQGPITIPQASLAASKAAAESAPVNVVLDRSVAKLDAKIAATQNKYTQESYEFTPSQFKWAMNVINKKTYLVREPVGSEAGLTRQDWYAKDPNYDNASRQRNPSITQAAYDANFITNTDVTALGLLPSAGGTYLTSTPDENSVYYVTENTASAEDHWGDVLTNAVFQAKVTGAKTGMAPAEVPVPDAEYYSFDGYYISKADMQRFHQYPDSVGHWVDFAKAPALSSLSDSIVKAKGAPTSWVYNPNPGAAFMYHGINFHKDGINYYNMVIRHEAANNPDSKGVLRNNIYHIEVTGITRLGTALPTVPVGPQTESGWLSANISINQWWARTQSGDL